MNIKEIKDGVKGVFSSQSYITGELIYAFNPRYIDQPTRTSIQYKDKHFEDGIGQYLNHHCIPNACIIYKHNNVYLYAIENIKIGEEITFNYNLTEKNITNPFNCNCHGKLITGYNGR